MSEVHDTPPRRKRTVAPSAHAELPPPLRWDDPGERSRWLDALRQQIFDAIGAGEDATRPLRKRFFSRHQARHRLRAAEGSIFELLTAAERGLTSAENAA